MDRHRLAISRCSKTQDSLTSAPAVATFFQKAREESTISIVTFSSTATRPNAEWQQPRRMTAVNLGLVLGAHQAPSKATGKPALR